VYDPRSNSWSEKATPLPDKLANLAQPKNGFYDPALNAVFLHAAGDSQDNGSIWVYRHKRGK
jgi:hypothetical protein